MLSTLNVTTFNVRGLGHPIKRKRVLTFLKKEKVDIAFLQETHLSNEEHKKLKRDWVGQAYFSSFTSNKRGTVILIHKKLPFIFKEQYSDSEGHTWRGVSALTHVQGSSLITGAGGGHLSQSVQKQWEIRTINSRHMPDRRFKTLFYSYSILFIYFLLTLAVPVCDCRFIFNVCDLFSMKNRRDQWYQDGLRAAGV